MVAKDKSHPRAATAAAAAVGMLVAEMSPSRVHLKKGQDEKLTMTQTPWLTAVSELNDGETQTRPETVDKSAACFASWQAGSLVAARSCVDHSEQGGTPVKPTPSLVWRSAAKAAAEVASAALSALPPDAQVELGSGRSTKAVREVLDAVMKEYESAGGAPKAQKVVAGMAVDAAGVIDETLDAALKGRNAGLAIMVKTQTLIQTVLSAKYPSLVVASGGAVGIISDTPRLKTLACRSTSASAPEWEEDDEVAGGGSVELAEVVALLFAGVIFASQSAEMEDIMVKARLRKSTISFFLLELLRKRLGSLAVSLTKGTTTCLCKLI